MAGARGEDTRLAAWRALLLAHAGSLRAIEADLAEEGTISLWWYDVLLELDWAPERRLRMQQLGARAVLSRTRVSRIVDELVDAGLAQKTPDPGDGRATLACITAAGRRELRRAAPHYLRSIEDHFTSFITADEQRVLAEVLLRIARHHGRG
ncbi:MAG TPA: MarR family winged helix-turn-helix transcriptional regulator [Acidimicrobiales bacterium]|nr:MarR family winged helix-turn-helix transcriptional regulator [Acidimicrobiales bacterium]